MNVVLWVLQAVLALAFLGAGVVKLTRDKAALEKSFGWAAHTSLANVKAIGAVEVLGALGLILPAATGIATVLTPLAATGLALTMAGAVVVHLVLKDKLANTAPAIVLLILSAVVAWGRFGPYHF